MSEGEERGGSGVADIREKEKVSVCNVSSEEFMRGAKSNGCRNQAELTKKKKTNCLLQTLFGRYCICICLRCHTQYKAFSFCMNYDRSAEPRDTSKSSSKIFALKYQ